LDNVKSATPVQFIRVKPLIIISSVLGGVILVASVALYISYDIFLGVLILQMITGLTWLVRKSFKNHLNQIRKLIFYCYLGASSLIDCDGCAMEEGTERN
jgi:hypothetical protein